MYNVLKPVQQPIYPRKIIILLIRHDLFVSIAGLTLQDEPIETQLHFE